jgi:hypothetical protein
MTPRSFPTATENLMRPEPFSAEVELPKLCDECAVAVYDCLRSFLELFECHYHHCIERWVEDHSQHNIISVQPNLTGLDIDEDDVPF